MIDMLLWLIGLLALFFIVVFLVFCILLVCVGILAFWEIIKEKEQG